MELTDRKVITGVRKFVGVLILKFLVPKLERLSLKIFGWKKERRVVWSSKLRKYPITSYSTWTDPKGQHGDTSEEMAIQICRERVQ